MAASSATSKLKSLDFYRKIDRELTKASLSGAGFSVIAAVAMTFLFFTELRSFLTVTTTTNVVVDRSQDGEFLRINFNLSLPALSCEFASVDVSDVLGTNRFNLTKTVRKIPIDKNLRPIGRMLGSDPIPTPSNLDDVEEFHDGEATAFVLTDHNFERTAKEYPILVVNFYAPWCSWCQRLEPAWEKASGIIRERHPPESDGLVRMGKVDCTVQRELCRKHHVQAYPSIRVFRKGSDLKSPTGQHDHESYYGERDTDSLVKYVDSLLQKLLAGDQHHQPLHLALPGDDKVDKKTRPAPPSGGCNIEGFVLVKKVPGNLMVSAHSGAHSFDASTMNMTHIVHHLSFGRRLAKRKVQMVERVKKHFAEEKDLLTGRAFTSVHDNITHDHYLQAVLTTVESLGSQEALFSYDYTAHSNILQSPNVPVVKFHYELSPMQVVITENRKSFAHFLTQVCAIIGGVFTVVGILDSIFHNAVRVMKKMELGKQF